jgi:hypothetical protein
MTLPHSSQIHTIIETGFFDYEEPRGRCDSRIANGINVFGLDLAYSGGAKVGCKKFAGFTGLLMRLQESRQSRQIPGCWHLFRVLLSGPVATVDLDGTVSVPQVALVLLGTLARFPDTNERMSDLSNDI